jgi:hypothetical protein
MIVGQNWRYSPRLTQDHDRGHLAEVPGEGEGLLSGISGAKTAPEIPEIS